MQRSIRPLRSVYVAATIALVAAAAACGQGTDPTVGLATPEAPEPTSTPLPEPLEGAACEPQEGGNQDAFMFLTAISVSAEHGYDRIIFEFEAPEGEEAQIPYYQLGPAELPLTELGSGNEVDVDGTLFLGLTFWASGIDLSGPEPHPTYTGPKSVRPETTSAIAHLREAGDHEHTMQWFMGLSEPACWRVTTSPAPIQIIVDIEDPVLSDVT